MTSLPEIALVLFSWRREKDVGDFVSFCSG